MAAVVDNENSVVRPVDKQVNEALEAAEPGLRGVLVLVGIELIRGRWARLEKPQFTGVLRGLA